MFLVIDISQSLATNNSEIHKTLEDEAEYIYLRDQGQCYIPLRLRPISYDVGLCVCKGGAPAELSVVAVESVVVEQTPSDDTLAKNVEVGLKSLVQANWEDGAAADDDSNEGAELDARIYIHTVGAPLGI